MKFDPVSFAMGVSSAPVDPELADATATRADILYPKTAYLANGHKNTGTIQSIEAATYTPSTVDQTIQSGKYLAGDQTILGDSNLIADNIKKSISIFGVTGTYSGITNESKSVRFIDYDGSILYSYTPEEFAELSSLPSNPSHSGLVAQGWNWNLSDAKTYVAAYGFLDIGQMYTTTSGATEIDIILEAPNLTPYLTITLNKIVNVDWGDGSAVEIIGEKGMSFTPHQYSQAGSYTIKITGTDYSFVGNSSATYAGVLSPTSALTKSSLYSSTITAIRLGEGATIDVAAFMYCNQMQYITIPQGATSIQNVSFFRCSQLKTIIIPNTVTAIRSGSFSGCYALEKVCIPNSVTAIHSESFLNCKSIQKIALPKSITSIDFSAFAYCSSLESIVIPNTVTTIRYSVFSDCVSLQSAIVQVGGIPSGIFANCHNLRQVTLSNSTQTIYDNAFSQCSSLQQIRIPSGVTTISSNAFANCYSLSAIHFLPTTPPTVSNSNAFSNLPANCIIYIPEGSLSAYTSATNYPSSSTYTYVEE